MDCPETPNHIHRQTEAAKEEPEPESDEKKQFIHDEVRDKLKFRDYEQVHESLEFVNGVINELDLVPEGF